ncbi:MAG: hypothetical protein ABI193_13475 [Minicystis sp.]
MQLGRLFDELTLTADRAGIRVRAEPFDPNLSDIKRPRGGLCTLRGAKIILVDAKLPLPERIATIAAALAEMDLDHLSLSPLVRATIGAYRSGSHEAMLPPSYPANDAGTRSARVAPLARTQPIAPLRGRQSGD